MEAFYRSSLVFMFLVMSVTAGYCGDVAVWIGSSLTLEVRDGVEVWQTLPSLLGTARHFTQSINVGKGGDTSTGMLVRFERDVLAKHPSVISIEPCYNDSGEGIDPETCRSNVEKMISLGDSVGAAITVWVPLYSCDARLNAEIEPYRAVIRSIIATHRVNGFDTYDDFAALDPAVHKVLFNPNDCQHLSPLGLMWLASRAGKGKYEQAFATH